jgi:DNA-binding transcriptional MerR regulator
MQPGNCSSVMSNEIKKVYYTIGEVAEKFNVTASLLRFWESEFSMLKPKKNKKGDRRYTEKDIEIIQTIYHLVKEKGYTLQGAKEMIRTKSHQPPDKAAIIESLEKLKSFLTELNDKLSQKTSG